VAAILLEKEAVDQAMLGELLKKFTPACQNFA
jgi:hypothetical protein